MLLFGVHQALKSTAILALAGSSAAGLAASQPDGTADEHEKLFERIQQILVHDGPYSAELLEPLTRLILLYEEGGDDALAAVAIERAVQVVRVNNGLYSLDQVPLVQQLIRIQVARGDHVAAWDLEQDLLKLVRRHPDDLRTMPVLRDIADRRMVVLGRYLRGEKPPELFLGCYYETWPNQSDRSCDAGTRRTVVQGMLADAQRTYAEAIAVMLRHGLYDSDELRDLELQLLRGVDLFRTLYDSDFRKKGLPLVPSVLGAQNLEPWRGRTAPLAELAGWNLPYLGNTSPNATEIQHLETTPSHLDNRYHRGRQSLRRLYAYGAASGAPPLRQVNAVVEMADWELLYSHNGFAVNGYELAYAALKRLGVAEESIEEIFAPATPVLLPAFQPNPLARDETRLATGHIDVAFEITKYGRGRAIEILETVNATADAKDRLVGLIFNGRFRPQSVDGQFAGESRVVARYYVY